MAFNVDQPHYQSLRRVVAERTSPLVAWVGSGPSRAAGLPDWPTLVKALALAGQQKADTLEPSESTSLATRIQHAERQSNPWLQVQFLEDALGKTSFDAAIRTALTTPLDCTIPHIYTALWRLPIRRMVTTNLDPFASRSFGTIKPGIGLSRFSGTRSKSHIHLLQSPDPIVVNLHGELDDSSSWILTQRALSRLLRDDGYKTLINALIATQVILFVGVSAEDVAAGGHLARLTEKGISLGPHYWITDRRDQATDEWAENSGIRVIRYSADDGSHKELDEAIADLTSFESLDTVAKPVVTGAARPQHSIPAPEELRIISPEELRTLLNDHARAILDGSAGSTRRFSDFLEVHAEPVHRAWFISTKPPNNVVLGYEIESFEKQGAFGRVYRAKDKTGNYVALKVLGETVRDNADYLDCFRRGVESMRILTERGVPGMVPYSDASEIPACAIMQFVEGPNLEEAGASHSIGDWQSV